MKIETRLEFKKYLKLVYRQSFLNGKMIFFAILGIAMLVVPLLHFLGFNIPYDNPPYFQLLFGIFIVFIIPILVYFSAKRNFNSNRRLQEKIAYEFTEETIKITGETFNSEMDWSKIYKIKELKNWILIYQSKLTMNIIYKDAFGKDILEFRELVLKNKVKTNIKE